MYGYDEVIARFVPDLNAIDAGAHVATILVRNADGQLSLQPLDPDSTLGQLALNTGAFRKGKPIFDPVSRKILGYEMEAVENPLATAHPQLAD